MSNRFFLAAAFCALSSAGLAWAGNTTPEAQFQKWSAEAGRAGQANRGEAFFNQSHGNDWSCASCHGNLPTEQGRHASTGKTLKPLAPVTNAESLTDQSRTDKWFRRNCREVLDRECTPIEKADVLAWLIQLKR
jgi:mono/diheme cytochrome c family protein